MERFEQLVKALRCCAENFGCPIECPRYSPADEGVRACVSRLEKDAADAIEELQSEIRQSMQRCAECGDELAQQLPKRGKWVGVSPMVDTVQCSVCGGQLFSAELETPYCPYCGAEMEVQE